MPRRTAIVLAIHLAALFFLLHAPIARATERLVLADAPARLTPVILIPAEMDPMLEASVTDLQRALHAMTGLAPIVSRANSATGQPFIAVGNHPLAREHFDAQRFDPGEPEAFVMKTVDNGLLLFGASDRGSSIAIYQWLHNMGCRWFFPGQAWEQVPRRPRIELEPLAVRSKPRLMQRRLWYGWGVATPRNRQDHSDWQRRNRLGGQVTGTPGHAYAGIANPDVHFAEHPEWFALVNGKRTRRGQLCLSNRELQQQAVAYALNVLKERPEVDLISASPNDGGGYCECNECAAMGSRADQTLYLANLMAEAVSAIKPDCYIGLYAYYANCMPPSFRAHPNVVIYVANGFIVDGYTFEELLAGWSAMAERVAVREYFDVMIWSRDLPKWKVERFANAFALFGKYNVVGVTGEASNNWGPQGLNYYVIGRLMWNPDADVAAVIDDFFTHCWGPAAPAMRDYYQMWKHVGVRDWSISMAHQHLDRAAELAGDEQTVLTRIDLMRSYMHWLWLYHQHRQAQGDAQEVATARRALHFSWRLANTNMVHSYGHYREVRLWRMPGVIPERLEMWKRTDQPVEAFIAPDVSERTTPLELASKRDLDLLAMTLEEPRETLPPIELLPALPREMVARLVREDRESMPRIEPVAFRDDSSELVLLADSPDAPSSGPREAGGGFSLPRGRSLVYLWAPTPGPATLHVGWPEVADRKPDTWQLRGAGGGEPIANGEVAIAEPMQIKLPLAGAGHYALYYTSLLAHTLRLDGVHAALPASEAQPLPFLKGTTRYYFYVPEGTERFLVEGRAQTVKRPIALRRMAILDADGQQVTHASALEFAREAWLVPVAAAQAGRVWSIEADVTSDFLVSFYGIPQVATLREGAMMVPRELLD